MLSNKYELNEKENFGLRSFKIFISLDSKREMQKHLSVLPISAGVLGLWFCDPDFFAWIQNTDTAF